jgi:hypothetical protein
MNAARVPTSEISEVLTWDQICARYPDEWVCLVEMDFIRPNGAELGAARVIGHGKTRRAPVEQAMPWREHYELIGHFFTGRIAVRPIRPAVIVDADPR